MQPQKTIKEYLKYIFSDFEINACAKDLAIANRRRAAIEQQKKEIDATLKGEIEAQNSNVARLSDLINNGYDYRDIECRIALDCPSKGLKTIFRLDTGEWVKELKMDDNDKQESLPLE